MVAFVYVILCLIWGSTWLAIKIGLEDAPPIWALTIRMSLSSVLLFIINYFSKVKYPKSKSDYGRLCFMGAMMFSVPYILVYWAEQYVGSAMMAILMSSIPFFTALFAIPMLKAEKLDLMSWIGLIIGFGGIIFIFYDSLQFGELVFAACWGGVIAAGTAGFSTVYVRAKLHDMDFRVIAAISMLSGTILMLPVALIAESFYSIQFTAKTIGSILYLSIFGSVIAFLGYYWLLKKVRAVTAAMIAFITPLIAIALGILVGSETLTTLTIVGTIMILGGVGLVIGKK